MNSLVVFLSVVALAVAKPSGLIGEPITTHYAPAFHSAPDVVEASAAAIAIGDINSSPVEAATAARARIVLEEPALVDASAFATAVSTPDAVTSQSRADIKASPIAYSAHLAYNTPHLAGAVAPALLETAYASPAWAKTGFTVSLDTPVVVAARAEAKAVAAPLVYSAPLAYSSPVITKAYGVHPW